MGNIIQIGYLILPEDIDTQLINNFKNAIPDNLLSFVNFEKEKITLAHSLAGRYLLNELLLTSQNNVNELEISLSEYKRPFLSNSSWQFSISHSHRAVVCTISEHLIVGIDIENIRPININEFQSQFLKDEFKAIKKDLSYKTFYYYWCSKEAITKAIGKGLYVDMSLIQISEPDSFILNNEVWHINTVDISDNYICSLATSVKNIKFSLQEYCI